MKGFGVLFLIWRHRLRYVGDSTEAAFKILEKGVRHMPENAYVLINVLPGQTANVKNLLTEIQEIKTIDACWGKPDIFAKVEVPDQEALTQLVLTKIHTIEGIAQTDTHLVYTLQEESGS